MGVVTAPTATPLRRRLLWHVPPRFWAPLPADVSLLADFLGWLDLGISIHQRAFTLRWWLLKRLPRETRRAFHLCGQGGFFLCPLFSLFHLSQGGEPSCSSRHHYSYRALPGTWGQHEAPSAAHGAEQPHENRRECGLMRPPCFHRAYGKGRAWHPGPSTLGPPQARGGSDDDGQSLVRGS